MPALPAAVVFDLDGTLVDSAPDLQAVLATMLGDQGLPIPSVGAVRGMVGEGARVLVQRAWRAAGRDPGSDELDRLHRRFVSLYEANPCRFTTVFPGVADALDRLNDAGVRLALCTNKPQRPTELLLDAVGLARKLRVVVGGDHLPVRKPDPAMLHTVLERLGVRPAQAVMVGDSPIDLETARAARVPVVLVSFGYTAIPARELAPDAVIDHFDELEDALRSLDTAEGAA